MHLHILASGSKGNAALVEGPEGCVLVDLGISRRQALLRCRELGVDPASICCVAVTHEHADHVKGLPVWSRHWEGRWVASPGTLGGRRELAHLPWEPVAPGEGFCAGGMQVQAFRTSHDVAQPWGLVFRCQGDSVGFCTDTGLLTPEALAALRGVRILALESNHDSSLLASGPYPAFLKVRVGGERGHLSNQQAAQAAQALVTEKTQVVVAMHLSQQNNRPSLAVRELGGALGATEPGPGAGELQRPDGSLRVCAAGQDLPMTVL